jgi:cytochrome c553
MRAVLKWALRGLGVVVVLALGLLAFGWIQAERGLARTYVVQDPPLTVRRDAAALAEGAHLFATRGCADCHGGDARGKLVFEAGPVMKIVGPNLTPGGVLKGVDADGIAAAIRHGVKPDGHPMIFMPSNEFTSMGDHDVAAIAAWLQSLPASTNDPGPTRIRPVGRVMYALGKLPLLAAEHLDHTPRARSMPVVAATAEYGAYLAEGCKGCHGHNFAGQHVPGTPPSFPDSQNLTPTGLGTWTNADFRHALRAGKRPDGSAIDTFMPWQAYGKMKDVEIDALWAYLQTLPAAKPGKR